MNAPLAPPRPVRIVGVGSCLGAPIFGPAAGPRVLRDGGFEQRLRRVGIPATWQTLMEPSAPKPPFPPMRERMVGVGALLNDLADEVAAIHDTGAIPLVLGGDHVIGAGTWRGVARSLAPRGTLGLLWIDAHLDAHTPATTHSGNIHGMPIAALLGVGAEEMTDIAGPNLDPAKLVYIGVRSWEPEEKAFLESRGVKIFYMPEVRARGLAAVLDEAVAIVRDGIPSKGMPGFKNLPETELKSLVDAMKAMARRGRRGQPVRVSVTLTDGTKLDGFSLGATMTSREMQLRTDDQK
ncbi:MAG TPA: arginase family protein, partial [Rhodocyclaceae bacterium]|nr:arginase family protein [Rhodocyclaceae bacterium]